MGARRGRGSSTRTRPSLEPAPPPGPRYDSENDEWMEGDDERVRPYEASSDAKQAAKREADEKVAARLHSEQRRHDGMREHREAVTAPL